METLTFTVDSALLQELGERLVGAPYIALAELIKNAYDADATRVEISFNNDRICISDNGSGMSFEEFRDLWMRVGSTHKRRQSFSARLRRPLTGSKGIGRLAVQFLGRDLELNTISDREQAPELRALVDWDSAVMAGDLTQAEVEWESGVGQTRFPGNSSHGTRLLVSRLNQYWGPADFEKLAREVWFLQPPGASGIRSNDPQGFVVTLESSDHEAEQKFSSQMIAFLDQWHARILGTLVRGNAPKENSMVRLELRFASGETLHRTFEVPDCPIVSLKFDIRTFYFQGRLKRGIKVDLAREYFNTFGGVYVYDAGFRLPYYGPQSDWLRIEMDHSHRLSRSKLLPEELQVPDGMNYLPTNSRLFGTVRIDTSEELRAAEEHAVATGTRRDALSIQVTRDRLADNEAFRKLVDIVRHGLDWYAMEEARNRLKEAGHENATIPVSRRLTRVEEVLERHEASIPPLVARALRMEVSAAIVAVESETEISLRRVALLGPLATAGMVALAYEHEMRKEYSALSTLSRRIRELEQSGSSLEHLASDLDKWIERAQATRRVFSVLLNSENYQPGDRLRAKPVVAQLSEISSTVLPGVHFDLSGIDPDLRLPNASLAEWQAVFQNVWTNAYNAMLDSDTKQIRISSSLNGVESKVVIEDTGSGVVLDSAARLFEPFVRESEISRERRSLSLGGSGLGLAIVRMVAENRGCRVGFSAPSQGFATAFELAWRESQ